MPKPPTPADGGAISADSQPPTRRRFFLTIGKTVAAAATVSLGGAASLALPMPVAAAEVVDPVFALAQQFLDADRQSLADYLAMDEFAPWDEWRANNPQPVKRTVAIRPNVAISLEGKTKFFDRATGDTLPDGEEVFPGQAQADADHRNALHKWKRREAAAKRRTGYRALEKANDASKRLFFETQEDLKNCIPMSWDGLAAKAKAFRVTDADGEDFLMLALMRDVAVLSGELDRAKAPALSDLELKHSDHREEAARA